MVKRIHLLFLLLVSFAVFQGVTECYANAAADLEHAVEYEQTGNCEQAAAIYQAIADDHPGTGDALEAQKRLTIVYIAWDKQAEADAAYQELLAKYSEQEHLAKAVDHVADKYRQLAKYEKAREVYQYIVDHWPEAGHAVDSQRGVVISSIRLGDESAARTAIARLLADFPADQDVADVIYEIAEEYLRSGKTPEALRSYQRAVTNWSRSEDAMWAWAAVARLNIVLGDGAGAESAVEKLIYGFSSSSDIAKALDHIADQYRDRQKYSQARQLYQYIVNTWPDPQYAMEPQRSVVLSNIALGDDANAQASLNELITRFSDEPRLPKMLYEIALGYEQAGRYDNARAVYKQIIQRHSDSSETLNIPLEIRRADTLSLAEAGDDSGAGDEVDNLIADFSGHEYLPTVVHEIAVQYHLKAYRLENEGLESQAMGCFREAAATFQKLIDQFPRSVVIPRACRSAGDCYRKLQEYEESIRCYQKIVDDHPGFETAWNALFLVGRNYEDLKKSGAIAKSEADSKTKAAYEQLLEKYPSCPGVRHARRWLSRYGSK
ncbi:MAG: tetratricopeptide repeat protein [Planctomycetota bacterium]|jgi:TolA-binding protein